jgi:CrcB protein
MLTIAAICIGACVGALGRWQLSVWLNPTGWLPWGTLASNWVGAYLVGFVVVMFQQHSGLDPMWRLAIVTGLLGALTTFSTFSLETVLLLQSGRWTLGLVNTFLQVVGSLLLTWAGIATAQRL